MEPRVSDEKSIVNLIHSQLKSQNGFASGNHYWLCCPFHGESKPSLSIAMVSDDVLVGTFHCFGCGVSGRWNTIAEKLKLKTVNYTILEAELKATIKRRKPLVDDSSTEAFLRDKGFESLFKWPRPEDTPIEFFHTWYYIPGQLLYDLSAYLIEEHNETDQRLFLPVKVYGKVRGGVRVLYSKMDSKKTYLTTEGDWVKNYGILPFDFVTKMIKRKKYKFIILTEGPRDALRLINLGLPAVAILGSRSFSEKKALILSSIPNVDTVYVMPDSDNGGLQMKATTRKWLGDLIEYKVIKLPAISVNEKGEDVPSDPQIVSEKFLRKVIKSLEKVHGTTIQAEYN